MTTIIYVTLKNEMYQNITKKYVKISRLNPFRPE